MTDFNPDDNITAQVSGAESKRPTGEPGVTIYTGRNIHFRFTGNRYIKFSIVGSGIDVTAVGAGRRCWSAIRSGTTTATTPSTTANGSPCR